MVVVHNRDPMNNCENTLIECTPKNCLKASLGLKNHPYPLFNTPKTITEVANTTIFFFSFRAFYSLHKVEIMNKNHWCLFKMPLFTSVILLKVHFLKGLE